MPNPVRRPSSVTISPVRASEVPCGAAITSPGRPAWAAMAPGRPSSCGGGLVEVAQREATSDLGAKLVTHQNRLRQRIVTIVGQREQQPAAALDQAELPRPSREDEGRCLLAPAPHLQL